jgi:hypothetical protein
MTLFFFFCAHGLRLKHPAEPNKSLFFMSELLQLDYGLISRAQSLADGAEVHEISQQLTTYTCAVEIWNYHARRGRSLQPEMQTFRERAVVTEQEIRRQVLKMAQKKAAALLGLERQFERQLPSAPE